MATASTPPPAPAGQNIAQTLGQTLSHAMPYVTNLHSWIWILVVSLFGGHIVAGLANIFFGKLAMIVVETILMLVMWIVATHPAIIAAELVTAMTVAGTDPNINIGDAAKSILTKWISLIATINAYAIGIPIVVLLLLDIKLGGGAMLMLLFMSIPLALFTNKLNPEGTLSLEIAQAGLIGAMVKIMIPLIEKADAGSTGELIRNDIVNYATPIGIIVMLLVLFGFGWAKTSTPWLWSKLSWLLSVRNLLKLIGFALFLFVVYWFFNPKDATQIMSAKVTEIQEATSSTPTPPASNQSQAGGQAITQPSINEREWEKIATKTCTIAWNNRDFKDGWCLLKTSNYPTGEYPTGEYRFETNSSLTKVNVDGKKLDIPSQGFPITDFLHDAVFIKYVNDYHPLPKEGVWRLLVKKSGDEQLFPTSSSVRVRESDYLYLTINIANTQENWEILQFKGKITVKVFKKK